MRDRQTIFHEQWLGLAQPVEGLVFSVPVLVDAQITPEVRANLTASFKEELTGDPPQIRNLEHFLRNFLGFSSPGMLTPKSELPASLAFYAEEGGQEIRPSWAIGRGPFDAADDPFAAFDGAQKSTPTNTDAKPGERWFALVWDLTDLGDLDLDAPESVTGPWRRSPTTKLERLLRHVDVPIGLLFNGRELRLVYAPSGESTGHLTFRVEHLARPEGRPILAALDLLLHARRAHSASSEHTLEGLLAASRKRQADVTEKLAKQVFDAVEILVEGFEAAAARDITGDRQDWLRAALEEEGDHFYNGVLSIVLRIVFLLYAEDQSLLPVEHPLFAEHLSIFALHDRLSDDDGAHPESMHHRFGAYGQLLSLFRAVFFGVKHGSLVFPPRHGKLFDPNAYPFLEGGLPDWTSAVVDSEARAEAHPPSIDDGTIYRVLHELIVLKSKAAGGGGQRLSYRALDVEQIGSVYESLMGFHVRRVESRAVRLKGHGVWVEAAEARAMNAADRAKFFKETCGLAASAAQSLSTAIKEADSEDEVVAALEQHAFGRRDEANRHRAELGRIVLQPGEERRRTASHYTPRWLTEKIVKRTLEPLLLCLGPNRTPEQILQLKICDPAMGSGAFLVATCRELANEIVAAWTRQGELARMIETHGDAYLHARRLVAQTCLYGVDKNAAAVELAKLSLWLVTLSKTLPFTFVDHALRHGDSLVGLDFKQIEAFHWSPEGQVETARAVLREALDQAVDLRQQIVALADHDDPASQEEKRRLFEFAQQAIDRVRTVADACVGAFFAETKDAARERERQRRLSLIERWLGGDGEAGAEVESLARDARAKLAPFHWWIEFPEVFFDERPDPLQGGVVNGAALMEGVVGNPPFGGKNNILDANPEGYLDWLKIASPGAHGNSDLSAHFFRRAASLLGEHGTFGLIATNTIAQGDTRSTGLKHLVANGWTIYDATDSMPWPGGSAAVTVSIVHAAHGQAVGKVRPGLDGVDVDVVNSRLRPKPERTDPSPLKANANFSFQGSIVLGLGFTLTPEERDALVKRNPRNAERIFPYLGGEEVNTSPTQSFDRYVISFGQMSLEAAERWPDLLGIVREKVKPERDRQSDNADGRRRKQYWWQFGRETPALADAIAPFERCLVAAIYTKHLCFSFQPRDRIFNNKLYVFPLPSFTSFCVLQSRVHVPWAWLLSSTLKMDLAYAPTDCFETFPFPKPDPRTVVPNLEEIGGSLYEKRAQYMKSNDVGLTKIYNAMKDSACDDARVLELRRLSEEMDRAVLDAYGWSDIVVPPFCPMNDTDKRALATFEDEVIDRLYVLNAERAREEERLGLGAKKSPKKAARAKFDATAGSNPKCAKNKQGKLF